MSERLDRIEEAYHNKGFRTGLRWDGTIRFTRPAPVVSIPERKKVVRWKDFLTRILRR